MLTSNPDEHNIHSRDESPTPDHPICMRVVGQVATLNSTATTFFSTPIDTSFRHGA